MKVSIFESVQHVDPDLVDITWAEFVDSLQPHDTAHSDREAVPLFSPAEWPPNKSRTKAGVVRLHFGVLDLDNITVEQLDDIEKRTRGIAHVFYSTWKHAQRVDEGLVRCRLLVAFSRPVEANEWPRFWPRMVAKVAPFADPACKDASRIYWIPSCPLAEVGEAFFISEGGLPLNVDDLLASSEVIEAPEVSRSAISHSAFQTWIKTWRPRATHDVWLKSRYVAMIAGEALAEAGERDNTIFKMVTALVERFPTSTAESLGNLFVPSLAKMAEEEPYDAFTLQQVIDKIERHQSQVDAEAAAEDKENREAEEQRIRLAFGTSRSTPYTADELAGFAVGRQDFKRQWVIQKDTSYYVFCAGRYEGPFTSYEVQEAAAIFLAPASSADVSVHTLTKQGDIRLKTAQELVHQYGQLARSVVLDMTAQISRFDSIDRRLVEAPSPMRQNIAADPNPLVAEWLRLMAGPAHDQLLDWLASTTRLNEPCSALYLEGTKGAGKTLLAEGVARIWTTHGPTELMDAMGSYNSMVLKCPLVFGDEFIPTDFRGRGRSGEIRAFIQARQRTLKRKYLSDATLKGCVRLMLAANNKDLLTSNENLTSNDIEAIVDRVLHIHVGAEAATFLKTNRLELDAIASHVLHLCETRQVDASHRFMVTGGRTELHRALTTSSGLRSAVCNWLVAYLLEPNKVDHHRTLLVRRYCGALCATSRGLAKYWSQYETNLEPPPAGAISKALAGLSLERKPQLTAGDSRRTSYWIVDPENLCAWAEDNGFADRETIMEILNATGAPGDEDKDGSRGRWRELYGMEVV